MKGKSLIIRILTVLLVGIILYYFMLPPINLSSPVFWTYVVMLCVLYLFTGIVKLVDIKDIFIDFIGVCGGTGVAICIVFAASFVFWLFWGRKRNRMRKEAWEKEKAEIDRARAFLKQQDEIKAQQQAEQAKIAEIMGSDAVKILAENSK